MHPPATGFSSQEPVNTDVALSTRVYPLADIMQDAEMVQAASSPDEYKAAAQHLQYSYPLLATLLTQLAQTVTRADAARTELQRVVTQLRDIDIVVGGGHTRAADVLQLYAATQVQVGWAYVICRRLPSLQVAQNNLHAMWRVHKSMPTVLCCLRLQRQQLLVATTWFSGSVTHLCSLQVWFTASRDYISFSSPPLQLHEEMISMHGGLDTADNKRRVRRSSSGSGLGHTAASGATSSAGELTAMDWQWLLYKSRD